MPYAAVRTDDNIFRITLIMKTTVLCVVYLKTLFVFIFQFRYKRRVYTQTHLDEKQLSKLHTKVRPNIFVIEILNRLCDTY